MEIRDPQINNEEINQRVQSRLEERRTLAESQGIDYGGLVDRTPGARGDKRLSSEMSEYLEQLFSSSEAILVSLATRERRVPYFSSFFFKLEDLLHRLVVKYVNRMAGRQIVFNRTACQVIDKLARESAEDRRQLEALEQRLGDLEKQIQNLETALRGQ